MEKVPFVVNQPVVVRLAAEGVTVPGRFGDQAKYVLQDGRVAYVPLFVRDRIKELGIQPGEEIVITKQETRNGSRRSVQWQVSRSGNSNGSGPNGSAAEAGQAANTNGKAKLGYLMQIALEKAVEAAIATEKYAAARGFCDRSGEPFHFTSEDIRAIGLSMYIDNSRSNHRAQ